MIDLRARAEAGLLTQRNLYIVNAYQERLFELMKEFDSLCKEAGAEYWLFGETLLHAVTDGTLETRPLGADAAMFPDDCRKFLDALEKAGLKDREIEHWGNSEKYPDCTVRYVASDTTAFSITDYPYYRTHGLHITIHILRRENSKKQTKRYMAAEKEILDSCFKYAKKKRLSEMSSRQKKDYIYSGLTQLRMGEAGLRRSMFSYFMENCGKPKKESGGVFPAYSFVCGGRRFRYVQGYHFGGSDVCTVEGAEFPVPAGALTLLSSMYPSRLSRIGEKICVINTPDDSLDRVLDMTLPYKTVTEELGLTDKEVNRIHECKAGISELNRQNRADGKRATEDWKTVRRTHRRMELWKHYMPLKDQILQLYEEGDYDRLKILLMPYDEAIEEQLTQGHSFAFDKDILKVYMSLLEHRGSYKKVVEIMSFLPQSHLKDIGERES